MYQKYCNKIQTHSEKSAVVANEALTHGGAVRVGI